MNVSVLCSSKKPCPRRSCDHGLALVVLLLASAVPAHADTNEMEVGSPAAYTPAQPQSLITERFDSSNLRLGKGDWVISGPLVNGFRRRPPTENRSLGRRILDFPIIRSFVPEPMPSPPGGGKYFLWGESSRPWASIAADARRRDSPDNPQHLEGGCTLISLSRSIREQPATDAFQPSAASPPAVDTLMMLNDAILSLPPTPDPAAPQEKGPDKKSPARKPRPKS